MKPGMYPTWGAAAPLLLAAAFSLLLWGVVWAIASVLLLSTPARSETYSFTLREPLAYDGDTLYALLPAAVPGEIREITIRVRGVDTAELRGACANEKWLAIAARDFVRERIMRASAVDFATPEWDKYGGRVLATVIIDGSDLAELLIVTGHARPYDGGRRESWCHE